MGLIIKQQLMPESKWSIKCPYWMEPTGITVHNTANDASAQEEANYCISNNNEVSFHWVVDDIEAIQIIREDRNAWHAGDGNGDGNRKSIGIEICYSASGGDRWEKAKDNACLLIVKILKERGWGFDRIKTHQYWSGKYCPHRILDEGWEHFYNRIVETYNKSDEPVIKPMEFNKGDIYIQGHIQDIGWQDWKNGNDLVGTTGESKRIEAIRMKLGTPFKASGIKYKLHIQNEGWHNWNGDGDMNGTEGKSLRAEAIQIELTGNIALDYDVIYRVHVQDIGWLEWVKNGEVAGTTGKGLRMEALQVILVKK